MAMVIDLLHNRFNAQHNLTPLNIRQPLLPRPRPIKTRHTTFPLTQHLALTMFSMRIPRKIETRPGPVSYDGERSVEPARGEVGVGRVGVACARE